MVLSIRETEASVIMTVGGVGFLWSCYMWWTHRSHRSEMRKKAQAEKAARKGSLLKNAKKPKNWRGEIAWSLTKTTYSTVDANCVESERAAAIWERARHELGQRAFVFALLGLFLAFEVLRGSMQMWPDTFKSSAPQHRLVGIIDLRAIVVAFAAMFYTEHEGTITEIKESAALLKNPPFISKYMRSLGRIIMVIASLLVYFVFSLQRVAVSDPVSLPSPWINQLGFSVLLFVTIISAKMCVAYWTWDSKEYAQDTKDPSITHKIEASAKWKMLWAITQFAIGVTTVVIYILMMHEDRDPEISNGDITDGKFMMYHGMIHWFLTAYGLIEVIVPMVCKFYYLQSVKYTVERVDEEGNVELAQIEMRMKEAMKHGQKQKSGKEKDKIITS